ncbi:hypothetical protein L6R53_00215 [Myxococcota bacterium]|nr:hypothetical protein [Myxococcota bacterium]
MTVGLLVASLLVACADSGGPDGGAPDSGGPDGGAPDSGGPDGGDPWVDAPTVLRLGPPSPCVGAYGIAADAATGQVYVSSLHVPFITLLDPASGGWAGSLDLREAGAETAYFPRLYVQDDTLWVTDLDAGRLLRFSLPDHTPLSAVELDADTITTALGPDGPWGASGTVLTRYGPEGAVETLRSPVAPTTFHVSSDGIAVADARSSAVALLDRAGLPRFEATVAEGTVESVLAWEDRLVLADRATGDVVALQDGVEVGRAHVGSDAFALYRRDDLLLVVVRQGAALPESGSYQGAPGLVVALDADLAPVWTAELGKTLHFLADDGERLWAMAEDSLQASAIDPTTGEELLRGPRLGLTIDHLQPVGDRVWFGSHLTDEAWAVDLPGRGGATLQADVVDTCGWPFRLVPDGAQGVVACQESGEVARIDLASASLASTERWADTFHVACEDGLCTGHSVFVGAAVDGDGVVVADPRTASLRRADGATVAVGDPTQAPERLQHFDVLALDDGLLAFEPRSQQVAWVAAGAAVLQPVDGPAATFPLVWDQDRAWAGREAWQAGPTRVALLPGEGQVEAAGAGYLVVREGDDLVVLDREDLAERGRLALAELSQPPFPSLGGEAGPVRLAVDEETATLLVGNLLRGTIELRSLPDLSPRGTGEVLALGRWADR